MVKQHSPVVAALVCVAWLLGATTDAQATNYFIDSVAGSDAANGLSQTTAWRTLAPLAGRTFTGGDIIRLKRGGQWRGSILGLDIVGNVTVPVIISAYGDVALPLPILNGADVAQGTWVSVGSNRYTLSGQPSFTQVIVDGTRITPARVPNTGYWTIDEVISQTQFKSAQATAFLTANGVGGAGAQTDIYLRHEHWRVDRREVVSFNAANGVITLDLPLANGTLKVGWGFYLGGRSAMVDQVGEWALEGSVLRLSLADAPSNHTIELSTRAFGITSTAAAAVTVENVSLRNYSDTAISLLIQRVTVTGVRIANSRLHGIYASGESVAIRDGEITDSYLHGIRAFTSASVVIERMTLRRNGVIGNQPSTLQQLAGVMIGGEVGAATIADCVIEDSGFAATLGHTITGPILITRNTVTRYCLELSDCGGIKFSRDVGDITPGAPRVGEVSFNTVRDGVGDMQGTSSHPLSVSGLYFDESSSALHVHHNIVDRSPGTSNNAGIKFHRGNNFLTEENTVYQYATWATISFVKDLDHNFDPPAVFSMANNITRNNDFFVEQIFNTTQDMKLVNNTTEPDTFGTFSNNTITVVGSPPPPPPTDTTPPIVTITAPAGSTVQRNTTVTIRATANESINIMEFYVGNVRLCQDKVGPYTCVWTVPSTIGAKYTLRASANDTAGNRGTITKQVTAQ